MKEELTPAKIDQILAKTKPRPVVVLVDDDVETLDVLERTFRDEGYEVCCFLAAEELLEQFSKLRPDVLVMEAILPGMSGLSALEALRPEKVEEIVPVLILSKRNDLRAKLLAFRKGAWDYLAKPFEAEEVAARVRVLVRSKNLQSLLQLSSLSDPLTSLYNPRFLLSWLERERERRKRYGGELSCLVLDLDGFHRIQEEEGERFGDLLLREFAAFLRQNTRASDLVGRFEEDQFLLFLPSTSKERALVLARRLRRLAGERSFELEKRKVEPSFCAGIVGCDSGKGFEASEFLAKAFEALGKAKEVGTGETAVFGIS